MTPETALEDTPCPRHLEKPSIGTCGRCGAFGCLQCLSFGGDQTLCAECIARSIDGLPSLAKRARPARLLLLGCAALTVLSVVATHFLVPELAAAVGVAFGVCSLATIVVFCFWFHLAVRIAVARGYVVGYTPAGAVGSWFIPIMSFIRPFDIARSMLSGAGADGSIVGPWQGLWVAGNLLGNILRFGPHPALQLITSALLVGAALTGADVVDKISAAVTSTRARGRSS